MQAITSSLVLLVALSPCVSHAAPQAKPPLRALLVVDVQGCFLPGGAIPVSGNSDSLIASINTLRDHGAFNQVVWTQDWHPPNHISFASVHPNNKQPQDVLQLAYTCVGSRWAGRGPRLCNMTELYPSSDESVTCLPSNSSSSAGSSSDSADEASSLGGSSSAVTSGTDESSGPGTTAAANSDHSSNTAEQDLSGSHGSSAARGGAARPLHAAQQKLASAAAGVAERIQAFGCPEPDTTVQQVLWPAHCVQHTQEASLHPGLHVRPTDLLVRKGWQPFLDAYSAFEDNGKLQSTGLAQHLRDTGVERVVVVGVALDYCVLWTALDAAEQGFDTTVALDATLPVSSQGATDAIKQLQRAGVHVIQHVDDVLFLAET